MERDLGEFGVMNETEAAQKRSSEIPTTKISTY